MYAALQAARAGEPFEAIDDAVVSPTYVPDLVNAALDLLIDGESGVWHLANQGACTWVELAREAARHAGFDPGFVVPRPLSSFGLAAAKPLYSALGSVHGALLPSLENGLRCYLSEVVSTAGQAAELPVASVS